MNFHETRYGARFFDGQLPKLISALEGISSALKAPTPVYQLKEEVPEGFLADLYHGNYNPSSGRNNGERRELTQEILACQKKLRSEVSPDTWDAIDRYVSLLNGRNVYDREQAFAAGFRSAMTMLVAGLSHHAENKMEGWKINGKL